MLWLSWMEYIIANYQCIKKNFNDRHEASFSSVADASYPQHDNLIDGNAIFV